MALTRRMLAAMGVEGEKVDEIINAHAETVEALKEERDKARQEAASNKAAAERLPEAEKELEGLKEKIREGASDPFEPKYEALKKEYEEYKAGVEARDAESRKRDAYGALLKEAGVSEKRINSVLKVTDLSKLELGEDGKPKGADKLAEAIKKEWADFIQAEGAMGADTPKPPEGAGGAPDGKSRAAEMARKYREGLYGKTEGN